ncbi:PQ-loop domain-containing transporter [Sphingomonas sp. S6]|jgi:MtN3 and saliva related transmembrane protein|uniref:PQ-loop domain-containing transporter n=1 Tax=Sphingomonas sp. S6 TaxID=3368600 RepID=UPI0028EF1891|nr:PQ-loop domain-containing transporter [uncultured Sphingomonas sp.]
MGLVEPLSLVAGTMTMSAPGIQAWKTLRTRDVTGLSTGSYVLLVLLNMLSTLIGVQYGVVAMIVLNGLTLMFYAATLFLISRAAMGAVFGVVGTGITLLAIAAPTVLADLLTTRWAEATGFIYGLAACFSFLPQVVMTHRTRNVSALALGNLALIVAGMTIWIVVCALLGNWSLIFWNSVLLLMVAELLRLKLTLRRAPQDTRNDMGDATHAQLS